MRWKKKIENKAYPGDKRMITMFAILPIKCENGEVAWLEKVNIKQEYRIDPNHHWINLNFVH